MSAASKTLFALATGGLLAVPSIASGATRSSTFAVTARVTAGCSILAPSALASSLRTLSTATPPAQDVIRLRCTQPTRYAIAMAVADGAAASHVSTAGASAARASTSGTPTIVATVQF